MRRNPYSGTHLPLLYLLLQGLTSRKKLPAPTGKLFSLPLEGEAFLHKILSRKEDMHC
jgi:hypothetical protein